MLNEQEAHRGEPVSYDKDWNLIPGEPESAGVQQGITLNSASDANDEGYAEGYADADGEGMANVGW